MSYYTPKQRRAIKNANARWNFFTGAVRSGKTYVANELLLKRLRELPDGRRAIIGKTEVTIMRNVLDPLQQKYGESRVSDITGKKRTATIFGKDFWCIGAHDQRSEKKLRGAGFQYVYGDEVTTWPEQFFTMLKSRLDQPKSRFDGTCNPEGPYHWLKQDMLDQEDILDLFHLHFTLDDNTKLDPHFKEQLKKEYTGVWYDRYVLGEWTLAEGLIYDCFDRRRHVRTSSEIPNSFDRYWVGIDYGMSAPTAFILIGLANDVLYVIDEFKTEPSATEADKTDVELADDFIHWLGDTEPKWILIDPSAKSFRLQLYRKRHQHPALAKVAKGNNEVLEGIREVSSLMSLGRLIVADHCRETLKELQLYSWDIDAQREGVDRPKKGSDHLMDALRYGVRGINPSVRDRLLTAGRRAA